MAERRVVRRPPPRTEAARSTTAPERAPGGGWDDASKPYCTCFSKPERFAFDAHLGVYVHPAPRCWRPSKAYYEAALQAGVISDPVTRDDREQ